MLVRIAETDGNDTTRAWCDWIRARVTTSDDHRYEFYVDITGLHASGASHVSIELYFEGELQYSFAIEVARGEIRDGDAILMTTALRHMRSHVLEPAVAAVAAATATEFGIVAQ